MSKLTLAQIMANIQAERLSKGRVKPVSFGILPNLEILKDKVLVAASIATDKIADNRSDALALREELKAMRMAAGMRW